MGISYMKQTQQAQQVQAERAAQATRKGNIWSVGAQTAANTKEFERQRAAKLFDIAHLNDPNVIRAQKRNILLNAGLNNVDPQTAAHYFLTT
jgi:hypothetical protein